MPKRLQRRRKRLPKRVSEALDLLKALKVPKEQQNERSAYALLALLGMMPQMSWRDASAPMLGITEMMDHFKAHFGKKYAPNTRETVRRFSVHQFVQMELVLANPDDPGRPVNSPDNRYQVSQSLLNLVHEYGGDRWDQSLAKFLIGAKAIQRLQPAERPMALIPVRLPDGREMKLTAGGQNVLVKKIVEGFCPRFTPGAVVVYVGDTGDKQRHLESGYLERLGLTMDEHGKMPDVVVHLPDKNWLVLIEAVTSHGPISIKRHNELTYLFGNAKAGLVFVTAFLTRRAMTKYLADISWETEVWVAEAPSHLIHFNGERFLGPYS